MTTKKKSVKASEVMKVIEDVEAVEKKEVIETKKEASPCDDCNIPKVACGNCINIKRS